MNPRGAGNTRRWQPAIAIVAALSLFVALVAGSALRPQFAAAAPPEPAAWSQGTHGGHAHAGQAQLHGHSQTMSHLVAGASRDSAPTNKKPFHSMWMTKDRPVTWSRLSPPSVRSPVPIPFTALGFRPHGTRFGVPAAACGDRDTLTRLCVARR